MRRKPASKSRIVADVSVPLFLIAARFVSKEPEPAAINGVLVQRHPKQGVVLVGTDGHRMMVLHDEHGICRRPITLDVKVGVKVALAMNKSTPEYETRWKVTEGRKQRGEVRVPLVSEPFPDWIRIPHLVNKNRGSAAHTLNAKYFADFTRAAGDLVPVGLEAARERPQIRLVPGKEISDPLLILFPYAPFAFGVLMPMFERGEAKLPAFIKPMM